MKKKNSLKEFRSREEKNSKGLTKIVDFFKYFYKDPDMFRPLNDYQKIIQQQSTKLK